MRFSRTCRARRYKPALMRLPQAAPPFSAEGGRLRHKATNLEQLVGLNGLVSYDGHVTQCEKTAK